MAHYAVLDNNNVVTQVFVGKDEDEGDTNWEDYYEAKRTSYNTHGGQHFSFRFEDRESIDQDGNIVIVSVEVSYADGGEGLRKNYAGIGYTYDEERDAFIPPQPYPSWTLNEDTCLWDSPVPYPEEGIHEWDEDNQEWVELSNDGD